VKGSKAQLLDRFGLLRPAYRAYEAAKSIPAARGGMADGLAIPPPKLRMRVICNPDHNRFLESGLLAAQTIHDMLAEHDLKITRFESIFEFGCGCGRVLRHWRDLPGQIAGSDYDADQVNWCRMNLPFAEVHKNGAEPPLEFDDKQFDFVYSLSVLIHIAPSGQQLWIDELRRVLAPGGYFLFSTHGAAYLDEMTSQERKRFDDGQFVFRWPRASGTSFSAGFHPDAYVRELTKELELISHVPAAALDTREDLYLFRRPL
jgi:SAM-dependent methyltransferase